MTTRWQICAPPPMPGKSSARWVISSQTGATAGIRNRWQSVGRCFLAGATLAWNANGLDERKLVPVLSRDVFGNSKKSRTQLSNSVSPTKNSAFAAPNETPLGTVITAPQPEARELFCRNGLKWFAKIPAKNIRATLKEIERQISILGNLGRRQTPSLPDQKFYCAELDLAARMAAQSCKFMLWQQAHAAGKTSEAKKLARAGIHELRKLDREFRAYWPSRNKATPRHCSSFLKWRIRDLLE